MIKRNRGLNKYMVNGDDCTIDIYGLHHIFSGTVIIDAVNLNKCQEVKWHIKKRNGLPMCVAGKLNGKNIRMQHYLFGRPVDGMEYDHINRNPLDNREDNMRLCSLTQNQWNRGLTKANNSGVKGVRNYYKDRWQAAIWVNSRPIHLGSFATKEEAALVYNEAVEKLHGEFAYLNEVII